MGRVAPHVQARVVEGAVRSLLHHRGRDAGRPLTGGVGLGGLGLLEQAALSPPQPGREEGPEEEAQGQEDELEEAGLALGAGLGGLQGGLLVGAELGGRGGLGGEVQLGQVEPGQGVVALPAEPEVLHGEALVEAGSEAVLLVVGVLGGGAAHAEGAQEALVEALGEETAGLVGLLEGALVQARDPRQGAEVVGTEAALRLAAEVAGLGVEGAGAGAAFVELVAPEVAVVHPGVEHGATHALELVEQAGLLGKLAVEHDGAVALGLEDEAALVLGVQVYEGRARLQLEALGSEPAQEAVADGARVGPEDHLAHVEGAHGREGSVGGVGEGDPR